MGDRGWRSAARWASRSASSKRVVTYARISGSRWRIRSIASNAVRGHVREIMLRLASSILADRRDRRTNEVARGKVARARAYAFAERGEVDQVLTTPRRSRGRAVLQDVRRKRIELREALRKEARCRGLSVLTTPRRSRGRAVGFHLHELVERGGDLNEPLEKVPLRHVRRDSPALLPRLVSLEEPPRVEEARTTCEGIIHRGPLVPGGAAQR